MEHPAPITHQWGRSPHLLLPSALATTCTAFPSPCLCPPQPLWRKTAGSPLLHTAFPDWHSEPIGGICPETSHSRPADDLIQTPLSMASVPRRGLMAMEGGGREGGKVCVLTKFPLAVGNFQIERLWVKVQRFPMDL